MGVTKLLARVVSSLDSEGEAGGLPDVAVEVFTEILNGGNSEVQQSLYDHLVHTDTEGKVVRYLERRLMGAFGGLVEAKNVGRIGSNDDTRARKLSADCDGVVLMARFLQLLCEGEFVVLLPCTTPALASRTPPPRPPSLSMLFASLATPPHYFFIFSFVKRPLRSVSELPAGSAHAQQPSQLGADLT